MASKLEQSLKKKISNLESDRCLFQRELGKRIQKLGFNKIVKRGVSNKTLARVVNGTKVSIKTLFKIERVVDGIVIDRIG